MGGGAGVITSGDPGPRLSDEPRQAGVCCDCRVVKEWGRRLAQIVFVYLLGVVLFVLDAPSLVELAAVKGPFWVRYAVLAGLCLLQLAKHKAPALALVAGVPLLAIDIAMGLTLAIALAFGDLIYLAVLYGSRRSSQTVVIILWCYLGAVIMMTIVFADSFRLALLIIISACSLPAMPVWWALNVRQQREIAEVERARADQLARIAELDRDAAVAAERASMARDLHDVIAGHLSAIAIQSEALLTMREHDPQRTKTVLRSMRENSLASLAEMRAMIGLLRSTDGQDAFTSPARLAEFERLVRSATAAGLTVTVEVDGIDDLPAAVDLTAYRIVQESLTNAVKHAAGANVLLRINRSSDTLIVEVTSDRPAGPPNPAGAGLLGMSERVDAVHGTLSAGPVEGGWRVRAEFPVEEA
ncbi:Signal transduction histidine kinase [Actinokineospora globicatena]|nr:Signal transduction histidine kinase [Actinokineospora globicatena]GLW75856.1 two-component sensor histidine kinase [Actinokineospora globicatena]GLW82694.1 two-component sensor histidine kinase [Actinokineospora globicatena]